MASFSRRLRRSSKSPSSRRGEPGNCRAPLSVSGMPLSRSSRAAQLLAHLDTHPAALLDTLRSIPPALQQLKPAPGRWSVAEVVEHLALVEPRLTQLLSARV